MIIAKTDLTRARAKLAAVGKNVKGTLPDVLESEGRMVAISLAKSTVPYGTGQDAKSLGEGAVSRDIGRVYATPGTVWKTLPTEKGAGDARQFWALIKQGKYDAARDILSTRSMAFSYVDIGDFDGGVLHRAARNTSTGRVSTRAKPGMIVVDSQALSAYRREKMSLVGFAKSAWAAIARELGGVRGLRAPKLPGGEKDITSNWITRKNAPHSVIKSFGGSRPTIRLTSNVSYADQTLSSSARGQAIRTAYDRLRKQLEIAARYEARQAMRRAA